MNEKPLLLCLSKHPALLEIRCRVLATRYDVVCLRSVEEMKTLPLDSPFELIVLCHTLSQVEVNQAVKCARTMWPGIQLLGITTPLSFHSEQVSALVDSLAGPPSMFRAISSLLAKQSRSLV
jgi:hypothetical protein